MTAFPYYRSLNLWLQFFLFLVASGPARASSPHTPSSVPPLPSPDPASDHVGRDRYCTYLLRSALLDGAVLPPLPGPPRPSHGNWTKLFKKALTLSDGTSVRIGDLDLLSPVFWNHHGPDWSNFSDFAQENIKAELERRHILGDTILAGGNKTLLIKPARNLGPLADLAAKVADRFGLKLGLSPIYQTQFASMDPYLTKDLVLLPVSWLSLRQEHVQPYLDKLEEALVHQDQFLVHMGLLGQMPFIPSTPYHPKDLTENLHPFVNLYHSTFSRQSLRHGSRAFRSRLDQTAPHDRVGSQTGSETHLISERELDSLERSLRFILVERIETVRHYPDVLTFHEDLAQSLSTYLTHTGVPNHISRSKEGTGFEVQILGLYPEAWRDEYISGWVSIQNLTGSKQDQLAMLEPPQLVRFAQTMNSLGLRTALTTKAFLSLGETGPSPLNRTYYLRPAEIFSTESPLPLDQRSPYNPLQSSWLWLAQPHGPAPLMAAGSYAVFRKSGGTSLHGGSPVSGFSAGVKLSEATRRIRSLETQRPFLHPVLFQIMLTEQIHLLEAMLSEADSYFPFYDEYIVPGRKARPKEMIPLGVNEDRTIFFTRMGDTMFIWRAGAFPSQDPSRPLSSETIESMTDYVRGWAAHHLDIKADVSAARLALEEARILRAR